MTVIAWLVLCVSVMAVGAAIAVQVKAARMVRHKQAGSEYLVMALWPVFVAALLGGLAGAIAGFWLATRTGSAVGRGALYAIGGILAAWESLSVIERPRSLWRPAATRRAPAKGISQHAEPYVAIESEGGGAQRGEQILRPRRSHASKAFTGPGAVFRWITADEAEDLLQRGVVNIFIYGSEPLIWHYVNRPPSGVRTGIMFIDRGFLREIYVDSSMESTVIPIARATQQTCDGRPQFRINGNWKGCPMATLILLNHRLRSCDLGDGPLDVGAVVPVVLAQPGGGGPGAAGGAQQRVVFVQVEGPPGRGRGAPGPQRAAAAGSAEDDAAAGGDGPGDAGRAGRRGGGRIDGEVIEVNPPVAAALSGPGLDHRGVPGLADRRAQVPGAVSRIAIPLTRRAAACDMIGREPAW